MGRERRDFVRLSGIREPSLIVIATEGALTETKYFESLSAYCRTDGSGARVLVLRRDDVSASSPAHIIQELDRHRRKNGMGQGDEFWVVLDRDRWPEENLAELGRLCGQKQYMMALSNPCFEVWLLLHHRDPLADYDDQQREVVFANGGSLKAELRSVLGSYNPANLDFSDFADYVETAIARADALDRDKNSRWPNGLGTRVYMVVQKIV